MYARWHFLVFYGVVNLLLLTVTMLLIAQSLMTFPFQQTGPGIPFRQGVNVHIFENRDLSPVANMVKYYSIRLSQGASASSPLFVDSHGSVLTRGYFLTQVHHLCQILGLDTKQCSGHSFRIGAATSAAAAGIDDHLIKALGRWSSTCYTRYIRVSPSTLQEAQFRLTQPGSR